MPPKRYFQYLALKKTGILLSLLLLFASSVSWSKDFGVVVTERSTSTHQHQGTTNQIILKNRTGFEGEVEVDISVDPPTGGLVPYIRGANDNTFTPNNQVLDIDAMPRTSVTPGDYKVTVTVTGQENGRPIVRVATYTITVTERPQFGIRIKPGHLVIKQGNQGTANVAIAFKNKDKALVQLDALIHGPVDGITLDLEGGVEIVQDKWGIPNYVTTRDQAEGGGDTVDSKLTVKVAPDVPPGEYLVSVRGVYNPERFLVRIEDQAQFVQGAALHVTVVADPQYKHLQDPPNFDLFVTEPSIVIAATAASASYGRYTEIGVWGDRWKSSVELKVNMREPSGGIRVAVDGKSRLQLPDINLPYGRRLHIVVPEDTPPGTYVAVVSATSKAPNGKTLTREQEIQIVIPAKPKTGGDPGEPQSAISLPEGNLIDDGYPADDTDTTAEAVATACSLLSVPADTIPCSVHTFKKPDTAKADPKPDVTIGSTTEVPEEAGGGYDTEVFVRNPDDNNLRKGCGDLTPDILVGLTGFDWGDTDADDAVGANEVQYVHVACNAAAQKGGGKKAVIRGHRAQLNTDLTTRKKADYKRKKDENHVRMDDSNKHLVVRNTVNDATADSPVELGCAAPKPTTRMVHSDPTLDKVPEHAKDFVVGAVTAMNAETKGIEKLDSALKVLDSTNKLAKDLGTTSKDLVRLNAATKFGRNLADLSVKSASGEAITTSDLKSVTDTVADLTGNKHVKTISQNFDALLTLEGLKLKVEGGQPIETKDITALVEKLDAVRGDRFAALGEVLGGIKKHAGTITKAEDMIKQMEKVSNFLDRADAGRNDSVKTFQAFSEYLDMLGAVAEKVPGMGEFMAQYAQAVKNMEGDVKTIAEAVRLRNEAIAEFKTAVEGYDYDKLMLDADQFAEEFQEGGGGTQLSADQINVNNATADELSRAEHAEKVWRTTRKCIIQQSARRKAIKRNHDNLKDESDNLPDQAGLDKKAREARNFSNFVKGANNKASLVSPKQASLMGFGNLRDAKAAISNGRNTPVNTMNQAEDAERAAGRREFIKNRRSELREEWHEADRKRKKCLDRLKADEMAYWQALRDYVKTYSWYSVYLMDDSKKWTPGLHARTQTKALTALDARIAAQGFQVSNGTVEVIVIDNCDKESTLISAGN